MSPIVRFNQTLVIRNPLQIWRQFAVMRPKHTLKTAVLLQGRVDEVALSHFLKWNGNRRFRHYEVSRPLHNMLLALLDKGAKDHILHLLSKDTRDPRLLVPVFVCIRDLVVLGSKLEDVVDLADLFPLRERYFREKMGLGTIEDFDRKYRDTFGKFRKPSAIITYASTLQATPPSRIEALGRFTTDVLEGRFPASRYALKDNPHLATIFKRHPGLRDVWVAGDSFPFEKMQVVDTDHPNDLLLLGVEAGGSCLRVNGNPDHAEGLLGYLLDGKNRAVVVKDSQGVILARSIIRLLWDGEEKTAVLFQERLYTDQNDLRGLVDDMCKRRAQALGLVLAQYPGHKNPLYAFKGPAPCEYVDALVDVRTTPYIID